MTNVDEPQLALLRALAFGYDRDLPFDAKTQTAGNGGGLKVERFEITSRYEERVSGLLMQQADAEDAVGPRPLILIGHPGTLDKASDYVLWPAEQWALRGAVCATIDQAGHGERARRPVEMADFQRWPMRRLDQTLQTAVDWMRTLDYLSQRPEVDAARVGFVGFSMGGMRGAAFVGLDERVRAASFCISGASQRYSRADGTAQELAKALGDPGEYAPLMAGRAVQVVAGDRDDVVTPEATRRFYSRLEEPREIVWLPCGHWDFMPQGIAPVGPFLERTLGYGSEGD